MSIQIALARAIHVVSSIWVFLLAGLIIADVLGRTLFLHPVEGTKEILQNSVIAVSFLQLPLAIYSGSMLRTTMLADALPPLGRCLLRSFACLLGLGLFAALAHASFPSAMSAVRLGEYEGEGALRIYTWPVRFLIVATSLLAALAYLSLLVADWRGRIDETKGGLAAPDPR
ncbi:TRAP transporter small permease (plasmid) [Salipiger sp. H15]|uniref:TRAP transporter small permease protein n=1 Tax=Alloyangia sp. H15 TaxID=3029062 RepID=A0AAU8APV3_9RHOB